MADCQHDCKKTPDFPKKVFNRPALNQIAYRIGSYSRMRAHMLAELNKDLTLQNWTHRGADDPGIALLEGNAIVGDILAFYQNLYANEVFLRTADWRESIAELVQLTGYRLAPGVGGEAVFGLKLKGDQSVIVPKGFGFKAQLQNRDQEDEFESSEEINAHPHLSEFNLYTPPNALSAIRQDETQLELHAVEGGKDLERLQSVDIKQGDRILLVPNSDMFDIYGATYTRQDKAEILLVSKVEAVLNRIVLTFEGALRIDRGSTIRAYKIDRTFRHFGYNVPRRVTEYDGSTVTLTDTNFERTIWGDHAGSDYYSSFALDEIPLDQEIDDLALGGKLICQGISDFDDGTINAKPHKTNQHYIVVKTVEEVSVNSLRWGNVEAAAAVVKIDHKLMTNHNILNETTDIRRTVFHEAISPELTLRAVTTFPSGAFSDGQVEFFGHYEEVKALSERELLLLDTENNTVMQGKTSTTLADFELQLANRDENSAWLWSLTLSQVPQFPREAFSQVEAKITVYGNPVHANQGKTEDERVLGHGDHRQTFQTFSLPKTPLTYLLDESQTPAQVPELRVYVNKIKWEQVEHFFNSGPDDAVYVVREDQDGKSFVQFGDGKTGMRLPSGQKNIVAQFRAGVAANGLLEKDKKPSATGKLSQLDKVVLPGEVVGGDEAETGDNAREAAPGKMQSLGRLVGLADFEAEALALPGVLKVRADWTAPTGTALIRMVILSKTGTSAAIAKVQDSLNTYNRCRGPARFPIRVIQGLSQYLYLKIRIGYEGAYRPDDVEAGAKRALGLLGEEGDGSETETGLFSWQQRHFGQNVHRSQILAAIQAVAGVTWVEIDDAQILDLGDPPEIDPTALAKPATPSANKTLACLTERMLSLHRQHLDLSLVMNESHKECQS